MLNSILQFVIGIGVLQAIFLGIMLLVLPGKYIKITKLTGTILLLTAVLMGSELMDLFDVQNIFVSIHSYSILIDLILVVLVWWLSLFILNLKISYQLRDLIHFLPFLAGLIWINTGFIWYGQEVPGTYSYIPDAIGIFVGFKGIFWAIYMGSTIHLYNKNIDDKNSFPQILKKKLFRRVIWPFILILFISLTTFWMMFFGIQLPLDPDFIGVSLIVCYVYFLSFNLLREPGLLIEITPIYTARKYNKSGIDPQQGQNQLELLLSYLESEKPFLDKKMGLNDLSAALKLSPNVLSQVINEHLNKSFNDLINECRLKEFKKKLLDPKEGHKTILALAFESGFHSKASFNRVFKKMEGITPSMYKQRNKSHPTQ